MAHSEDSFDYEEEMLFQKMLLGVQESLTGDDLQDMIFLCSDHLGSKDLSMVSSVTELFSHLETRELLSRNNLSLLLELLTIMKQHSLIRKLGLNGETEDNGTTYRLISPYRQLLFELSQSITDEDLKKIKFLLKRTLSRRKLEKDMTLLELFSELEKKDLLDENNVDILQKIIGGVYPALEKRIIQYKTESEFAGQQVIAQETENILSMSNTSVQMPQYEMKGDRRGTCLIINNYNFRDLPKRDGTDIDKESLEAVFQWLGFEVWIEHDCDKKRMLDVLEDLAGRDHAQADCVVCCVLSHGEVDGVFGTDGKKIPFRMLMEPLNSLHCQSLYQKPKLFFIQACRGTREQRAVFPYDNRSDDVTVSDAAVPKDSISEEADFLLAMATVPHYASFREKKKGTWYIQALCDNLKLLVPRGVDLLSILTKVNDDVSRKSDISGLRKQMPQPEFTLTKRVVFPVPKTCLPQ